MKQQRTIKNLNAAVRVSEGAGVTVYRSIGSAELRQLDPFLMMDHMASDNPDEYLAGFPAHPHRGFTTLTYMLEGHMQHKDSMGNKGDLQSGGVQWMKAASGVIHSEMPGQTDGVMSGFQLWINLPARLKMSTPAYQDFSAQQIPEYQDEGSKVRLISGSYRGLTGPVIDEPSQLLYLDVTLESNRVFEQVLDDGMTGLIYVINGTARLAEQSVPEKHYAVLSEGETLTLSAAQTGVRFLLIAGRPINETVIQHGPFVMNTQAEITQAIEDYQNGSLVRERARSIVT